MSRGMTSKKEKDLNLFKRYMQEGFKPLRCKGYHSTYNSQKDYKTAKEPVDSGFTREDFKGLSIKEIQRWIREGGWIGWLIPKGYIALDVEGKYKTELIESILRKNGIEPWIHVTDNGKHYLFKVEDDVSANSEQYTRSGLEVTYRVGGKNYLILAPINNRRWERW